MSISKIARITVAVTNMERTIDFYRSVFQCHFEEMNVFGRAAYSVKLDGIDFLLVPGEIVQEEAQQSRHQFDFFVDDITGVIERARASGGKIKGEVVRIDRQKAVTILDPDGNTSVFIQQL